MDSMDIFVKYEEQKQILYHGSKSGIKGQIQPKSRKQCDFGSGFYLGDNEKQPKSLIAPLKFPDSRIYRFSLGLDDLKIYRFEPDLEWALFIAYNRGRVNLPKDLCDKFDKINNEKDVIVGVIADDTMTQVLDEFFNNTITDKALVEALKFVNLGLQYVLKTQKACDKLELLEKREINESERKALLEENHKRRTTMSEMISEIRRKYLRDGNYFVEIIGDRNE